MKIGLSYSRCVRDIVDGTVDIDDVLVVVSRTNFDPHDDEQWKSIWEGYHFDNPEWYNYGDDDEDRFRSVSIELWESGKLHQPRVVAPSLYGNAHKLQDTWYDIVPSPVSDNESVQEAWNHYTMIKNLAT